jgi:RND family efflux transporter MFP subunit
MKFFAIIIIVAGLGAGGYYWYTKAPAAEQANPIANRPTSAVVESRDIRFVVNAAGDIGPADQVSVRPEVNGRIAELPVDIGDKVRKGSLLCRLDDKDLQIERSQRLTEIDSAKFQLQKARRNFERSKHLFGEKLISVEVYEDTRTEFDLASNSLQRTESALHLLEESISKTKIMAPFDCTVLTRPVSVGQAVSGSAGFNSGTEVMTIANLNDMIVTAHINQADVTRLKQGQNVEVQIESVPGLRMEGVVDRIAPQAILKNGIKGFAARVAIKDIDARVRPGMTAIIGIPIASAENVLAVPLSAVFTERGEHFVFVKDEDKYEKRTIVIGVADYSFAEVQKGLESGEVVSLEQPPDYKPAKPIIAGAGPGFRTGTPAVNSDIGKQGGGRRSGGGKGLGT